MMHTLPDGRSTTSDAEYVRAWRDLGAALVKALGPPCAAVDAFDPALRLRLDGSLQLSGTPSSVFVPVWMARRIVELAESNTKLLESNAKLLESNAKLLEEKGKCL